MTLLELEVMIRRRRDGGDKVNLRLSKGRWELKVAGTTVYGHNLDHLVGNAIEAKVLTRST